MDQHYRVQKKSARFNSLIATRNPGKMQVFLSSVKLGLSVDGKGAVQIVRLRFFFPVYR